MGYSTPFENTWPLRGSVIELAYSQAYPVPNADGLSANRIETANRIENGGDFQLSRGSGHHGKHAAHGAIQHQHHPRTGSIPNRFRRPSGEIYPILARLPTACEPTLE